MWGGGSQPAQRTARVHPPTTHHPFPQHPSSSALGELQGPPHLGVAWSSHLSLSPPSASPIALQWLSRRGHAGSLLCGSDPLASSILPSTFSSPPPSLSGSADGKRPRGGVPGQGAAEAVEEEVQEVLGCAEVAEGVQELLHVALQEGVAAQRGPSDRQGLPPPLTCASGERDAPSTHSLG